MSGILGVREGLELEFKSGGVLDDLTKSRVGVAVVAFLNSKGGDLYIGVRDEDDVAVAIDPIDDPEAEARRVYDHLVDSIEPAIDADEVRVEVAEVGGQRILRVRCSPNEAKRPYAFVSRQGRWFSKRLEARVRNMTRRELASAFAQHEAPSKDTSGEKALKRLGELRNDAARRKVLWIGLQPHADLGVDVLDAGIKTLCTRPEESGQRPEGWNAVNPYAELHPVQGKELHVGAPEEYTYLRLSRRGAISFEVPTGRLHWNGPEQHIWPLALAEFPASFFRLARAILSQHHAGRTALDEGDRFVAQLAIFGLHDWHLVGGGIRNTKWPAIQPPTDPYPEAELVTDPIQLTLASIRDEPDWCGYRLVSMVYRAFNLGEDAMVPEFDRERRRLVLPDPGQSR